MNVAILTLGTRGDVQPYVALGAGLKQAGHEVTLITGKGFDELDAGKGLRYVALDLDLLIRAITEDERMRGRAAEVGEEIRTEDGVSRAVEIVAGRTSEKASFTH